MPFSFLSSKKETEIEKKRETEETEEADQEKLVVDFSEEDEEEVDKKNERNTKQDIFNDTVVFDEDYYRTTISEMYICASNLFQRYKEILKEEITNEIKIFNMKDKKKKTYNDIFVENGI